MDRWPSVSFEHFSKPMHFLMSSSGYGARLRSTLIQFPVRHAKSFVTNDNLSNPLTRVTKVACESSKDPQSMSFKY